MSNLERRLELLKMEGSGFNQAEIVKHLSSKYRVSERQVYYDFEKRVRWQPMYQQFKTKENAVMRIINRYEHVYREAAFLKLNTSHDNLKIGALKVMLDANRHLAETVVIPELMTRLERLEEEAAKHR
jgi:nicotinic acid phosphoribosyltransferase